MLSLVRFAGRVFQFFGGGLGRIRLFCMAVAGACVVFFLLLVVLVDAVLSAYRTEAETAFTYIMTEDEGFIPAGNEPSECVSIHLANAARVTYQCALKGTFCLQRLKLDAPLLAAGLLTGEVTALLQGKADGQCVFLPPVLDHVGIHGASYTGKPDSGWKADRGWGIGCGGDLCIPEGGDIWERNGDTPACGGCGGRGLAIFSRGITTWSQTGRF